MEELIEKTESIFEDIKHIDEEGKEYWYARELQKALEYKEWRKFKGVIDKAIVTCESSNYGVFDHFVQVDKIVKAGATTKKILDYKLSRYACYLISLNGDSHMKVIALAKTYFAVQTRRIELLEENYQYLTEDEKRLYRRKQARNGNLSLNYIAMKSGVRDFAKFHNAGYKGLYNGETADDIAKRKELRYREDILDNMSSEELGANIFRITQTEAKLKRDKVNNEYTANSIHHEIGKKVRKAIKDIGGTMPEDLPTPKRSLKGIEKEELKKINDSFGTLI